MCENLVRRWQTERITKGLYLMQKGTPMKNLRSRMKAVGLATLIGTLCAPEFVLCADAPGRAAMNTIIEGAKKEGKVSWGSYLDDAEVGELNKAFQKEFPFV